MSFRYASAAMLFTVTVFSATPQSGGDPTLGRLLRGIPTEYLDALFDTGVVTLVHDDADSITLAPAADEVRNALGVIRSTGANIVSERLVLVERSPGPDRLTNVYNALLGVSDLAYLEYYNPVTELWKDLFKESYRVVGPSDLSPVADEYAERIPDEFSMYVLQGLPPFGEVLQTFAYHRLGADSPDVDGFTFISSNEWPIRYRNVRVVRDGAMQTFAFVVAGNEFMLLYGVGAARVFTAFGMFADRIENSFTARTAGLFEWLTENHLEGEVQTRY